MPENSPEWRQQRSRLGSYESWARTEDRPARTAPARKALLDKFERQVDPDGKLAPAERTKRAEYLRKAYFTRLAMASAKVRRQRAAARAAQRQTPEQRIAELEALAAGEGVAS